MSSPRRDDEESAKLPKAMWEPPLNAMNALRGAICSQLHVFCDLSSDMLANHCWQVGGCHCQRFEGHQEEGKFDPVSGTEMSVCTNWLFDALLTDYRCRNSMEFSSARSVDARGGNASIERRSWFQCIWLYLGDEVLSCLILLHLSNAGAAPLPGCCASESGHMMTDMIPSSLSAASCHEDSLFQRTVSYLLHGQASWKVQRSYTTYAVRRNGRLV